MAAVALVVAIPSYIVVALLGFPALGFGVAGLVAALIALVVWGRAESAALHRLGAVPADPGAHARLHNLLDSLCIAGGLSKPAVHLIDDPAPNALSVGRSPNDSSVVVTTGLLQVLDRVELEAVLAHELSHIRNGDVAVSTVAATTVGLVAPSLVARLVDERCEPAADAAAVELTRFPPALISALEKLIDHPARVQVSPKAMEHLWIEAPSVDRMPGEERVAILREL